MSVVEPVETQARYPSEGRSRSVLSDRVLADTVSAIDASVIFLSGVVAHVGYDALFSVHISWALSLTASFVGAILAVALFRRQGLYHPKKLVQWWDRLGYLAYSWTLVCLALVTIGFLVKVSETYSRGWAIAWFVLSLVTLFVARMIVGTVIRKLSKSGKLQRRVAIVGTGECAQMLADELISQGALVSVVGSYSIGPDWSEDTPQVVVDHGNLEDLIADVEADRVDDIVLAIARTDDKRIWAITEKLARLPIHIRLGPDMFAMKSSQLAEGKIGAVKTTTLLTPPLNDWARITKGIEDRVLSALLLVLIAPAMALIAVAIKIESKGPVFFIQRRNGFNHEVIPVWKFRTMRVLEDGPVIRQATRNDDRITRVGRLLRLTSLDELPQLVNVLRGEMSLVGPRPHAIAHNEEYSKMFASYSKRHRVKPGITGWAQINGYRGEITDPALMEKRVEYDLAYIEGWSLWFDIKIILLTPFRGLIHPNAY